MSTDIMLDLETLGNRPGAVIVAIGAVEFHGGEIIKEFYLRVDADSCVAIGLKLDVSTVMWWLKQSDIARMEITKQGKPIRDALAEFSKWIPYDDCRVWGNGASFDNTLLAEAYSRARLPIPWKFWNERCYRTVKNLHLDVPFAFETGTQHNALDDAKAQARHLITILDRHYAFRD